jgi:hypothetical protein
MHSTREELAVFTLDPSLIDTSLDSRSATFENLNGGRGRGGQAHEGRKGAPSRSIGPGETVVLADLDGPGTVRHIWMTFPPAPPEVMRAVWLEAFYDGRTQPSVSVPCLDFFGLPHGRPVPYMSALSTAHEGRGFNAYIPMPFADHLRVELTNSADVPMVLYYQIDYTLEPPRGDETSYLHVAFRRENPTAQRRDFVIAEGLDGPGRFLGCNVGVRVVDPGSWYGEGEVKVYRDGDKEFPTICGTGLEDYVGTAWGMGPHAAPLAGAPLVIGPDDTTEPLATCDFVGFYRWHLPDAIMFSSDLRVTIQQIGMAFFFAGHEDDMHAYLTSHPPAGSGWNYQPRSGIAGFGIAERVDDYCATSYVYCREPQAVPRLDVVAALADIGRRKYEQPSSIETMMSGITG